jgi:hypothetical protein
MCYSNGYEVDNAEPNAAIAQRAGYVAHAIIFPKGPFAHPQRAFCFYVLKLRFSSLEKLNG